MTLTTIPSIRPSSSTTTTSFDLRSARRHRGRWGPLPVWPQLFGGQCGAARGGLAGRQRGSGKRTPPGCVRCADSSIYELVDEQWRNPPIFASTGPPGAVKRPTVRVTERRTRPARCRGLAADPAIVLAIRRSRTIVGRTTGSWVTRCHGPPIPNRDRPSGSMPSTTGYRQGRASCLPCLLLPRACST